MPRSVAFAVACLIGAGLTAAACGGSNNTSGPTAPSPTLVTETFPGSINVNGAFTHQFAVQNAGTVTAALTSLGPDSEGTVGLSIGTWNSVGVCQITLANDAATQGTIITGTSTGAGNLCTRIYDTGRLTQSATYEITVTHY